MILERSGLHELSGKPVLLPVANILPPLENGWKVLSKAGCFGLFLPHEIPSVVLEKIQLACLALPADGLSCRGPRGIIVR